MNTREVGKEQEERACRYLTEKGFSILEQNFRSRFGEIDIVAMDGATLVFIEVKYRTRVNCGTPETAVDYRKRGKIIRTADYYRMKHRIMDNVPCRFDVLAETKEEIWHFKNAFDHEGRV